MTASVDTALILFAHGSRDPEWVAPFAALRESIAARTPGVRIALAYLESTEPSLSACIRTLAADGIRDIRVLPLFLAMGKHLRDDVPAMAKRVAGEFPALAIAFLPALGEAPEFGDALARIALRAVEGAE